MKKYFSFFFLFTFSMVFAFTFSHAEASAVTLQIEGSNYPVTIPYGATTTLSWTSSDMSTCTASQTGMPLTTAWNGSVGTSGSVQISNLTKNVYFSLVCQNSDSSVTTTGHAQAYVDFLVMPSLYDVSTKEPGGKFVPGKKAYVIGKGFLPTHNAINIGTLTTSPSATLYATSSDGKNLMFTVPELGAGTYSIWLANWNGSTGFLPITIVSTSTSVIVTPMPIVTTVQVPTTSVPVYSPQVTLACTSLVYDLKYQSRDSTTKGGVSVLQSFLQKHGDLNSEPTGYFGGLTLAAVKKFQGDNSISTTGFVGPLTRAKITAVSCKL